MKNRAIAYSLTKCLEIKCEIALYNGFCNIDYILVKL